MTNDLERSPAHNLLARFEQQVAATPAATALIMGAHHYTYGQVNARANQIARALQTLGVLPGTMVGICLPRSPEAIFALFGVIKAGAAYVPIDPAYPLARQQFMVNDAQLQILLVDDGAHAAGLAASVTHCLALYDESWQQIHATTNLDLPIAADSLLYVLYTSGSTGDPKGVCGSHRQMRNRLQWLWSAFPVMPDEVWCNKTTLHFVDASLEMFGALLQGSPLVILTEADAANPEAMLQVLAAQRVTRLLLVISHLRTLLLAQPDLGQRLPVLTLWVVSGERLTPSLVQTFQSAAPQAQMVNLYGCTEVPEVSWVVLAPELDLAGRDAPIGKPITGSTVYIVDENLQPVPRGEVGELVVSSPLMSLGYLQRAAETAARFLTNPFGAGRIYRTGDRVFQAPDGLLHYVGRLDHLVKIRGYRVELPEIETALAQADARVKASVVVVKADQQLAENKELIAFVTPATVDVAQIGAALHARLPVYMLPAQIIPLAEFPLTLSGKVDRQALLASVQSVSLPALGANATPAQLVQQIWQAVLQVDQIVPDANFFEVGGNSLRLAQLYQQLRRHFGERTPTLTALLQYPTLAALVHYFDQPPTAALPLAEPTAPAVDRTTVATQLRARRLQNGPVNQ